jgi:hypothetical protein
MTKSAVIIASVLVISLVLCITLLLHHINGPRIVASAAAPDGTELRVVQTCNWNGELFTTRVECLKRGTAWESFYYDHQDGYWGRGTARVDPVKHLITVMRDGRTTATFDYASDTFTLQRRGFPHRATAPGRTR